MRIGRIARTLRRRLGWRQLDLAKRAGVSQQTVSRVERGRVRELSIETLTRVLAELEVELELNARWRGGEIDRVVDEGHARLVAAVIERLDRAGWIAIPEVTYSIGRERGSIDVLGYEARTCALLVIEVKADVTSAEATLRKHDEKERLAAAVARDRFGWRVETVSRLLVLPESSTARRRFERHAALFGRAYSIRGLSLRKWLLRPTTSIAAVLFLSVTRGASGGRELTSRRRMRVSPEQAAKHEADRVAALRRAGFIDSAAEHSGTE